MIYAICVAGMISHDEEKQRHDRGLIPSLILTTYKLKGLDTEKKRNETFFLSVLN